MKTEIVDLCPHCKQPLMYDAPTSPSAGGATVKCDHHGCANDASFIQHRHALCFVHAELPALPRVMNNFYNRHKVSKV